MFIVYIANNPIYDDCVLEYHGYSEIHSQEQVNKAIYDWVQDNLEVDEIWGNSKDETPITFNVLDTKTQKIKSLHLKVTIQINTIVVEDCDI